ncbi:MAG: cytochrome c-type biogenesis protein [Candidatus Sedimenticola sp. PURPLELP]
MRKLLFTLMLIMPLLGLARIDAYHFDDSEKEARFKVLIEELRCLVCQNQNLADSNAELAQDMRKLTYEMVQRGSSNEEIVTYMVQRYGDFVMYRPPMQSNTLMLWAGPFIILAIGVVILITFVRARASAPAEEISEADHELAERLLNQNKDNQA